MHKVCMCSSQSVHQVRQMQTLQTLQTWCTLHPSWILGVVSGLGAVLHDGPLARAYVKEPAASAWLSVLVAFFQRKERPRPRPQVADE
jgi:hypothetical protein